ncbi:unnamed protein product [Urochloa humidicola]
MAGSPGGREREGDGRPERSRRFLRVRTTPPAAPVGEVVTAAWSYVMAGASQLRRAPAGGAPQGRSQGRRPRLESAPAGRLLAAVVVVVVRGGGGHPSSVEAARARRGRRKRTARRRRIWEAARSRRRTTSWRER